MAFRIAIDCGGTFTDGICVNEEGKVLTAKARTTPDDLTVGARDSLVDLALKNNLGLKEFLSKASLVVHGTTLGTNIILERKGAKTGLIATKGFRDAIEFRGIIKEDMFNWRMPCPRPLSPRYLRVDVEERLDQKGQIRIPLDESSVKKAVDYLKKQGVESIAVSLLFSFVNPSHERRIAEIINQYYPEVSVSLSSTVLPAIGEFERVSTTLIDAYIAPAMAKYIREFENLLEKEGFKGELLFMQNNGGVETWKIAIERPATLALSGPAAGPIASSAIGKYYNEGNIISVDMGGTSFDCGVIYQGEILTKSESLLSDCRFSLPVVDVFTAGAGGGSIAWFDMANRLKVGPQSAGALPGPVCYGKRGEEPTVTDADVVLGYISPDFFLGGEMQLNRDLAEKVIKEKVADRLGLSTLEGAAAIYKVINAVMADAISRSFSKRGYDPRDFTLCVAGAAGPVHGVRLMQELRVGRLLIPKLAPIHCAFGMLGVDLKHDYTRFYYTSRNNLDLDYIKRLYKEMETQATETLTREGIPKDKQTFSRSVELRYYGQFREVEVPLQSGPITEDTISAGVAVFHTQHKKAYGYSNEDYPIEFMKFNLTATGSLPAVQPEKIETGGHDPSAALKYEKDVFFETNNTLVKTRIYNGDRLLCGNILEGPCIVEEKMTTIVIPPEFRMKVDEYGNYVSV